jgi:mRNA interferase HigB
MFRILSKSHLRDFWEIHNDSESYLKKWYEVAKKANWQTPAEVKVDFPTASVLKDSRMVFNIKGNDYRLIAKFNFEYQLIYVRFVGTHSEYDKVDANTV